MNTDFIFAKDLKTKDIMGHGWTRIKTTEHLGKLQETKLKGVRVGCAISYYSCSVPWIPFLKSVFIRVHPCPITVFRGALNYAEFRAAMHPTWCMAEREGFEPSVPLLAEHTISSRAPSASSVISPQNLNLTGRRFSQIHADKNLNRRIITGKLNALGLCPYSKLLSWKSAFICVPWFHLLAERVGFEPTWELLAPKSISSRPRYGHFGTSPELQN